MSPTRSRHSVRRLLALLAVTAGLLVPAARAWCSEEHAAAPAAHASEPAAHDAAEPAAHAPAAESAHTPAPSAHPAPAASGHHAPGGGHGAAVVALARLMVGNERFAEGRVSHPHQDAARRRALVGGQQPSTIVVACSDSRVAPEVLFDQGLGDLFVVRVAGNTLDATGVASIEYAVEHLGSSLIVVLGHHSCGAVKTALTVRPEDAGSPDLTALVAALRPRVERWQATVAADPTLDAPVRANVDAVCGDLTSRSAIVRHALASDRLALIPALYSLRSGRVEFWGGPAEDEHEPPAAASPAPEPPRAEPEGATAGHP